MRNLRLLIRAERLQWNLDEAVGRDLATLEVVHRDAVSGVAGLDAIEVGKRGYGGVKRVAVAAETEAQKIGLAGALAEARVRVVAEPFALEVQHRDGLVVA